MVNNTAENKNDRHERNESIIRTTNEITDCREALWLWPQYIRRIIFGCIWVTSRCPGVSRNKLTDTGPLRTRRVKRFNLTGCLSITIAHWPRRKLANYERERERVLSISRPSLPAHHSDTAPITVSLGALPFSTKVNKPYDFSSQQSQRSQKSFLSPNIFTTSLVVQLKVHI